MSDHAGERPVVFDDNYRYGNSEVFPARRLHFASTDALGAYVTSRKIDIDRSFRLDPEAYEAAVAEIGASLAILEGKEIDGVKTTVEIAVAGREDGTDEYTATYSTGSSSIWNNKQQAAEHALRASGIPNFLYVTAPGQGGSSDWTPEEKKYIRDTGRYILADGKPLPSIAEKQRLLEEAGFTIVRSSSDADGCNLAIAHGAAMEPGQLTHVHLNNAPITDKSGRVAAAIDEIVNQYDDRQTGRLSEDPARLTPEMIAAAQEHLPKQPNRIRPQSTRLEQARTTHTPGRLAMVAAGINRGRRDADIHPAALDVIEMMKIHPEAAVVFSVVKRAMAEDELRNFLTQLGDQMTAGGSMRDIFAIYTPGTRRMHKAYPTVRESIRNYAFQR